MNWTDDSWSRQENVVVTVESAELAALFVRDFEELWEKDLVEESGFVPPERIHLDGVLVRPWVTPGYGEDLSHRIAKAIGRAKRVRICSPVITAERVLAGEFSGKPSTPWGTGPLHDFMHAKVVVADEVVFTGSFNLSRSGEQNAENVLEIHYGRLAEHLGAYV